MDADGSSYRSTKGEKPDGIHGKFNWAKNMCVHSVF